MEQRPCDRPHRHRPPGHRSPEPMPTKPTANGIRGLICSMKKAAARSASLPLAEKKPAARARSTASSRCDCEANESLNMRVTGPGLLPMSGRCTRTIPPGGAGPQNFLFEGAQGTLRISTTAAYPYVTSSNPVSGGACHRCRGRPDLIDANRCGPRPTTPRLGRSLSHQNSKAASTITSVTGATN